MGTLFSGVIAKIALVTAAIVIAGGAAAGAAIAVSGHSLMASNPAASNPAATDSATTAGMTVPVTIDGDGSSDIESGDLSGRTAPSLPDQASDNAKGVIDAVFGNDPHTGADFGAAVSTEASDGKSGGTKSENEQKSSTSTSERTKQ